MSQSVHANSKGYVATAALGEGIAVKISSGQVVVATAATDKIIGVTMNKVAAGETASVHLRSAAGTMKVKAGGAVAVGDYVTSNGTGQSITTVTAGNQIIGMALEAGALNDFIEVMPMNDRV
jgi:hypothetical protein